MSYQLLASLDESKIKKKTFIEYKITFDNINYSFLIEESLSEFFESTFDNANITNYKEFVETFSDIKLKQIK